MKPTYDIILDFDDVIYPFCQGIMAVLAVEGITGTITQWALENDFNMEREPFWDLVYQQHHNEALFMQPIPARTLASLRRLRGAGHRIHIVTARTNPTSEFFAREVVQRDGVPHDSITFTKDKGPMVAQLNAAFSLDDGPHNYAALDQPSHLTYLMDAPHNQQFQTTDGGMPVRRLATMHNFANTVAAFQEHGVQLRGVAA